MRLEIYLTKKRLTIPEFAEQIGVTPQAVHRYVRGERIPRLDVMDRIIELTGGKVEAGDLVDASRAFQAAVAGARAVKGKKVRVGNSRGAAP